MLRLGSANEEVRTLRAGAVFVRPHGVLMSSGPYEQARRHRRLHSSHLHRLAPGMCLTPPLHLLLIQYPLSRLTRRTQALHIYRSKQSI